MRGPWQARRLARRLPGRAPCIMCEMGAYGAGPGSAPRRLIEQGRSTDQLLAFALDTQAHWQDGVCGRCRGDRSGLRCRPHLLEDSAAGRRADRHLHARWVRSLHEHLRVLSRSFVWEYRGSAGPADQAALFAAAGWLSGWRPLLALLE